MDGDIRIGNRVLLSRDSQSRLAALSDSDRILLGAGSQDAADELQSLGLHPEDQAEPQLAADHQHEQPSHMARPKKSILRISSPLAADFRKERQASGDELPSPNFSRPIVADSFVGRRSWHRTATYKPNSSAVRQANKLQAAGRDSVIQGTEAPLLARADSGGSIFEPQVANHAGLRARLRRVLEGLPVTAVITLATFLGMFMDDCRLAFLGPTNDVSCQIISFGILAVFFVETVSGSILRTGYFLRLYFWIDALATVSMLFDIPLVVNRMGGSSDPLNGAGQPPLQRQVNAAWVYRTRSILKVTRILRLMRLVRLYQRYKAYKENLAIEEELGIASTCTDVNWWEADSMQQSRVGQKLSDIITLRVVIGILALLLIVPSFNISSNLYGTPSDLVDGGLAMLTVSYTASMQAGAAGRSGMFNSSLGIYIQDNTYRLLGQPTGHVVSLAMGGDAIVDVLAGRRLRTVELTIEKLSMPGLASAVAIDNRWLSQLAALLNILRTLFICLAIYAGTVIFNHDASRLVLQPIQRMLKQVRDMSDNPMAKKRSSHKGSRDQDQDPTMETKILENCVRKILALLAIGFGEAGAEVIGNNIKSNGDLNPMLPGHRVMAIFGFCDIRQFTDATEVLQEEVMEFVNSIAKIVHLEVALHGGSPNKNVGDAFLLVWKLLDQARIFSPPPAPPSRSGSLTATLNRRLFRRSRTQSPAASGGLEGARGSLGSLEMPPLHQGSGGFDPALDPLRLEPSGSLASQDSGALLIAPMLPAGPEGDNPATGSSQVTPAGQQPGGSVTSPRSHRNQVAPVVDVEDLTPAASPAASPLSSPFKLQAKKRLSWAHQPGYSALPPGGSPGSPGTPVEGPSDSPAPPSPRASDMEAQSSHIADRALAAFIIIHAALKRSRRLQFYSARPDLNERMPHFQVRMGFGLHVGWAIEGAIGSEFKIDASYLSPNVNMASRLEAATKQFGTTILLSGDFAQLLSPAVRARCRQIDCVTVKGSVKPLALYTYDVSTERVNTPLPSSREQLQQEQQPDLVTYSMQAYESEFAEHPDLALTWAASPAFLRRFQQGFDAYIAGNWTVARQVLTETRTLRKNIAGSALIDGPSSTLLGFMATHDYQAPSDWPGYRELTEK